MKVIIPAAGLGTRLRPLTLTCPKEMLPVGGAPVMHASLLELAAAGLPATVVVGPGKEILRTWVAATGAPVTFAEQTHPRGTLDAVECGRGTATAYAVLYPDIVHLPDQTALSALLEARGTRPEATWFALVRRRADNQHRLGPSACVEVVPTGGGRHRITSVAAGEGLWHTTFAEIRGPAHQALLDAGPLEDTRVLPILQALAERDLLYGLEVPGDFLDLGIRTGFDDATHRFATRAARWREEP